MTRFTPLFLDCDREISPVNDSTRFCHARDIPVTADRHYRDMGALLVTPSRTAFTSVTLFSLFRNSHFHSVSSISQLLQHQNTTRRSKIQNRFCILYIFECLRVPPIFNLVPLISYKLLLLYQNRWQL